MERTSRCSFGQDAFDQDWPDMAAGPILAKRLVIRGTGHDDTLVGTAANEIFKPRTGADDVTGGGGYDALVIDYGEESVLSGTIVQTIILDPNGELHGSIIGGDSRCEFIDFSQLRVRLSDGNDYVLSRSEGADTSTDSIRIDGGDGIDILSLQFARDSGVMVEGLSDGSIACDYGLFVNFDEISVSGTSFDDIITNIEGYIMGNAGNDRLSGSDSDDILDSSLGTDTLEGGGGADLFDFSQLYDSSSPRRGIDTILDFSSAEGDWISLGILDADKTTRGRQVFDFIGDATITDAGQLRSVAIGDGIYQVEGNTDDDADLEFVLIVHADAPLVASDFGL